MRIHLRVGAATDQGRVRSNNQDSFRLAPDADLFIVADGMGGHQGGEVASQMAVDTIAGAYDEPSVAALVSAVLSANEIIYDRSVDDPSLRGMGTTVVVAALVHPEAEPGVLDATADDEGASNSTDDDTGETYLGPDAGAATVAEPPVEDADDRGPDIAPDGDGPGSDDADPDATQLVIANVGDSRAYLYRDGDLIQLTEDHSMVADLVREGRISPEEAESHPQRNILTRVLGVYREIEVDLWPVDPVTGDRYLLCSDGLFNEVGEDTIGGVLRRLDDPTEVATELVRLANEGGGRDNITVVVLDVVDDGGVARSASAALGATGHRSEPDLAGFTSTVPAAAPGAGDDDEAADTGARQQRRRFRRAGRRTTDRSGEPRSRTRVTWRLVLFVVVLAAVLGGAYATVVWYGTSTYYVGFDDDDDVAIFRGRPGGLLWIDPELVEGTELSREDVPARWRSSIESGREFGSRSDASRFVANVARDAGLGPDGRPTTTTTRPTTTTSVAEPAPVPPDDPSAPTEGTG
jgi:PPM family protein phosphatase